MKNKIKKHNKKIFFAILLTGLFFGGFLFVSNVKADSNCICSSGGAIPGVYNKDAEYDVTDSNSCKQACMSVNNAKYYSFSDVANIGFRRLYNCLCVKGSLIPFYYPMDSKFDTNNDDACNQQCANQGTAYYSYSDLLNLGTTKVTKTPTVPVASVQSSQPQPKKFNYTLLESFPGFFKAGSVLTDLPTMILAIYKFGIWTVGIAGLFMLVVGGFMYMASAGNTSTAGNARGIIWDALLGIVAALGAYLILYVINPELTKINLSFTPVAIKFDNIDASNPQGSTICQKECVSVADICKESPCSLHKPLAEKLRTALQGQNAWITEGWPVTVKHSSSCHGNGTCADVNLKTNKGDVQAVKKLYDAIVSAGLKPVYEDTAAGCVKYNAAGVYCRPYPTMTAPSFHVNNT